MARRPIALLVAGGLMSLALLVTGMLPSELAAANKSAKADKKPIRVPKYNPSYQKVDLFEAMESGQITAKVLPKSAMAGTVLIENKTDKPLNVKVPEAVVAVPIHAQFGGGMGGMGGGGMGGMGGGGMGGGGGGQQAMGGGMGGGGMGGGGMGGGGMGGGAMGGGGGGFFSIPPEKVVSVPLASVCLEHGKQEPNSRSRYALVPVEKFNSDPVLFQLLSQVGTGKLDSQAAQAAAWHLTDKMSFDQLAAKTDSDVLGVVGNPYFSPDQLAMAKQLLNQAQDLAADAKDANGDTDGDEPQEVNPRTGRKVTAK